MQVWGGDKYCIWIGRQHPGGSSTVAGIARLWSHSRTVWPLPCFKHSSRAWGLVPQQLILSDLRTEMPGYARVSTHSSLPSLFYFLVKILATGLPIRKLMLALEKWSASEETPAKKNLMYKVSFTEIPDFRWLGRHTSTAGGLGSILAQRTKILNTVWWAPPHTHTQSLLHSLNSLRTKSEL